MQKVDIDELKPSMVLGTTIKDKTGNIIFLRGTELTERHITILRNRDIKSVSVEGSPIIREGASTEDLHKEIDSRFSTAGHHPIVLKIRDLIKELLT